MQSNVAVLVLVPVLLCMMTMAKAVDGAERTFFIAADDVAWDYAPSGRDEVSGLLFNDTTGMSSTGGGMVMDEEPPSTWVLPGPQR